MAKIGTNASKIEEKQVDEKSWKKVEEKKLGFKKKWKKVEKKLKNIARGTTDPGYWVYNLNHFSDWNQFESISDEKVYSSFELNTLGPLCLWQCFCTRIDIQLYVAKSPDSFTSDTISLNFNLMTSNIRSILPIMVPCDPWQN